MMVKGKSISSLDEITFAFLDVETTGLHPHFGDRICEVGILRCKKDEVEDSFESLINPGRSISPGASAVNGITDDMVKDKPKFSEIAGDLLKRLEGAAIVCHNAPFDLGFLGVQLKILRLPPPTNPVLDTLSLARKHYSFPSNSLGRVAGYLGIKMENEHRAMGDALATKDIFKVFLKDFRKRGVETLEGLLDLQGGSVPYPGTEEVFLPPIIDEAVRSRERVKIRYLSSYGQETIRSVEPIQATVYGDYIYLVAYCHLCKEERTFRLDRILEMEPESK